MRLPKRIREYINEVLNKSQQDKWIFVRDFVSFCYWLALCPVTEPNFKVTWLAWVSGFFFLDDFVFLSYTLILFRNNLLRCVETMYTFGVVAAVSDQDYPTHPKSNPINNI